ncbi:hypothetical protein QVD17_26502 [Tagetes erecta]|uniref:NAC domain-containing protein n=1 Tax=Tagetes erecta TaxID=13708 RepID=A0AAD8NIM7_TARER|nr:hypothetical protein QVD17_26502 [Tagetes erecta]
MNMINRSSDLIDAKLLEEHHHLCGSKHSCPGCGHPLQRKPDWMGLPAGVKFDPTDQELIEHLQAKFETNYKFKSHPLIDDFIPTIEGEDGICYTHPEKLPGVTRDGLSRHFFHRPSKAYTTGTRKRRKIQTECDLQGGETRWHKTGKTRPVMVNGKQKGCKKILVLYTNFGKNRKPEKTNWVMHQYHLGQHEEEREGELVVSKIFYQTQPRQCNWSERASNNNVLSNIIPNEGADNIEMSRRQSRSGSGSCSSSKEVNIIHTTTHAHNNMDELSVVSANAVMSSSYNYPMDHMQHLKGVGHFSFAPFRKTFDEVGTTGGEASTERDIGELEGITCDEHELQRQHHLQRVTQHNPQQHKMVTDFHVKRSSHHTSTHISTPLLLPHLLHHNTLILDDQNSFHVSRIMDNYQEQQHHHHKMGGGRLTSGLEELIMGCTPSSSNDHIKEESSITNHQETDWMKYSTFWPDHPGSQDHH